MVPCRPDSRTFAASNFHIKASCVRTMGMIVWTMWYFFWMTRTFRPGLPLCREASNCSSLHPFGCFSSTSWRHSVYDQLWDFFPKHKYGKTTTTVRTMWYPVQTHSSIRQVMLSKSRLPDDMFYGSDARATYIEIVCIKSIIQTTCSMVWTHKALIWKLRPVKVRPSGRGLIQARISAKFWKPIPKLFVRTPYVSRPEGA